MPQFTSRPHAAKQQTKLAARLKNLITALVCALVFSGMPTLAIIESQTFATEELEARYSSLIKELRCLVCQNQNLADSDADLAKDLRNITADMLRDGKTDAQIRSFMQERYGDFVLYRTPLKPSTLFIWIGPAAALLLGLWAFFFRLRAKQASTTQEEVDPIHLEKAKKLLKEDRNP